MLADSWKRCWSGLNAQGDAGAARDALLSRWSEPARKYHTPQHLAECIAQLEPVQSLARRPAEVEAALWFHDAVYELGAHDNEERSAQLAREMLADAQVASDAAERVAQLVLSTRHTSAQPAATDADTRLLLDIDLSILGAPPARFAEYERQIREEYSFVDPAVFAPRRRAILQTFLDRARIYETAHFHDRLEARARDNLRRSLAA